MRGLQAFARWQGLMGHDKGERCLCKLCQALSGTHPQRGVKVQVPARRCSYTGMLFCMQECHLNENAVLPHRVMHAWDFSPCPVCVAAAQFLAATADLPLLCIGAIAPGARLGL